MSTETSIVFFGVRFAIAAEDIPMAEKRALPIVLNARSVGLQFYWENFGVLKPEYYGFVGRRLVTLGADNETIFSIIASDLESSIKNISEKLRQVGITETPSLHACWLPPKE